MSWTVGEVSKLTRVSVRTLHHYDEIGLLAPSARSDAGYRLYSVDDLERLQQILLFRELGFALPDIAEILSDPTFDRAKALKAQRNLLAEKVRRTEVAIDAIDLRLLEMGEGIEMTKDEASKMFGELFDGFDPAEYEDEVQERWGETDAYKQSAARTKRYGRAEWELIKAEDLANTNAFIALMDAGVAADSPEAMALAEDHREHISKWFYDLPVEFYGNMAAIWVNDPRFTKNIDKPRAGLAAYKYAAVVALVAANAGGASE
ncbi:MAG: MerR family transcriptional regulator [Coriobacteriia bacterium]|nr:MerR family transcriptional regulator [Coriobacteriia bacterium]